MRMRKYLPRMLKAVEYSCDLIGYFFLSIASLIGGIFHITVIITVLFGLTLLIFIVLAFILGLIF